MNAIDSLTNEKANKTETLSTQQQQNVQDAVQTAAGKTTATTTPFL